MSLLEDVQVLAKRHKKELKKFRKIFSDGILAEAEKVFAANPEAKYISWTQYIPGFNDGDTCEFTITDAELGDSKNAFEEGDGYWFDSEINDVLQKYEELTRYAFGVDVRIIIKRGSGKLKVVEYDCGY